MSHGLVDLLRNSRYEGHPPLWYVVLFSIYGVFTHDPEYRKVAQEVFAIAMVYVLLWQMNMALVNIRVTDPPPQLLRLRAFKLGLT